MTLKKLDIGECEPLPNGGGIADTRWHFDTTADALAWLGERCSSGSEAMLVTIGRNGDPYLGVTE